MISAVIFKYINRLIIIIYFGWKQFSPIRILSVIWINLRGTDKIFLLPTVKLHEDKIFVPLYPLGTNGGQKCWKNKQTRENMTPKIAYFSSI